MDQKRHALLDTLGLDLKNALTRAATFAETTVDAVVQLALGRKVTGLSEHQLTLVGQLIERDGFVSRLAGLSTTWPEPAAPPAPLEVGPLPDPALAKAAAPTPPAADAPTSPPAQ